MTNELLHHDAEYVDKKILIDPVEHPNKNYISIRVVRPLCGSNWYGGYTIDLSTIKERIPEAVYNRFIDNIDNLTPTEAAERVKDLIWLRPPIWNEDEDSDTYDYDEGWDELFSEFEDGWNDFGDGHAQVELDAENEEVYQAIHVVTDKNILSHYTQENKDIELLDAAFPVQLKNYTDLDDDTIQILSNSLSFNSKREVIESLIKHSSDPK